MKPVIGIAGNLVFDSHEKIKAKMKCSVEEDYIQAVKKAGGIPMIIPVLEDPEELEAVLARVDGILLIGGLDINPECYNEKPEEKCGPITACVDDFYMNLIHMADDAGIPVFGICKGFQTLNVAFGGTLFQDLSDRPVSCICHMQAEKNLKRDQPSHSCTLQENCWLHQILKKHEIQVNSFHHQGIKTLAHGFRVSAIGEDGVIEAIEKQQGTYMAGVQWHPEMLLSGGDPESLKILTNFVRRCQ